MIDLTRKLAPEHHNGTLKLVSDYFVHRDNNGYKSYTPPDIH